MKEVVLYFGSFNPLHNGHTAVANYVLLSKLCDELWFVLSPQNPLKPSDELAPDKDRLEMTQLGVGEVFPFWSVRVCDIEFELPRPSYTIDTLRELEKRYPDCRFSILGGADMFNGIDAWKESEQLLANYRFWIYPRDGAVVDCSKGDVIFLESAPQLPYSSTDVREAIEKGERYEDMVCFSVADYIKRNGTWRKKIEPKKR